MDPRKLRGRLFDAVMDALAKVTQALPASWAQGREKSVLWPESGRIIG